jgi:short-subunit dehydrogenase
VGRTGRLDYIFNNAGVGIGGTVHHFGIEDWNYIVDVNIRGVVNGAQAAYKMMMQQGFGHIINTASIAGIMPSPASVAYAATKHAVVGLSTSLRAEAAQLGIRVSVICPGVIRTPILEGGKYGRMLIDIPPDKLRQIWEKLVSKNRAIIIVPARWKLFWLIYRLFPAFGIFLAQKHFQKMQKELDLV